VRITLAQPPAMPPPAQVDTATAGELRQFPPSTSTAPVPLRSWQKPSRLPESSQIA